MASNLAPELKNEQVRIDKWANFLGLKRYKSNVFRIEGYASKQAQLCIDKP